MKNLRSEIDINGLRNGDRKAWETLHGETFRFMYHLCNKYINDDKTAEEIVQDAFTRLWEMRDSLTEKFNIKSYLYTIVKNNSLNHLRNLKIAFKHHENIRYLEMHFNYEALEKTGDYLEFEELRARIENAIEKLPGDVKETFKLSRFEELSYKKIAEKQEISVKTVESRMSKSLKILRDELKDYLPVIFLITKLLG